MNLFIVAKSDFCFTYYDGDAASDMQHMNRLERGAYSDLILFQRKIKGAFTIDQAKKFLSNDFEFVWPSLELILQKTDDGKYFIEWLAKSEAKAKSHSEKQKNNQKGKNFNQTITKHEQNTNQTLTNSIPLGDGDGDRNGYEDKEGVQGEIKFSDQHFDKVFNEMFLADAKMAFRQKDVDEQLKFFILKVRGSPDFYANHDDSGLKLAFQSQLRSAKNKPTNEQFTSTKQQAHSRGLASAFVQTYGSELAGGET